MSDDDDAIHNELEGREAIKNLPISKLMMDRIQAAETMHPTSEQPEDTYSPQAVAHIIAAIGAAITSLERDMRQP